MIKLIGSVNVTPSKKWVPNHRQARMRVEGLHTKPLQIKCVKEKSQLNVKIKLRVIWKSLNVNNYPITVAQQEIRADLTNTRLVQMED